MTNVAIELNDNDLDQVAGGFFNNDKGFGAKEEMLEFPGASSKSRQSDKSWTGPWPAGKTDLKFGTNPAQSESHV